jgi:hypothetical protein
MIKQSPPSRNQLKLSLTRLFKATASATTLLIFACGCASVAVTGNSIEERTAFALGLDKNEFSIDNRRDNGMRTDYIVQTKGGVRYNCYVTGTLSVTGRVVSDAICSQPGGANAAGRTQSTPATPCNALLKAAGKC